MGWVARVRSFVRVTRNGAKISDVQVDTGGGPNVTPEHFAPPGDDSFPLDTDYATGHSVQQTGRVAVTGYIDPKNTPKAQKGDKRIYARDSSSGAVVVEVWLKNDGTGTLSNDNGSVTLRPDGSAIITTPGSTFDAKADGSIKGDNGSGSFELQTSGDFVVNGVTIAANGDVTIPNSLNLNNKEIAEHDHAITSGSSAPGPTGVNN